MLLTRAAFAVMLKFSDLVITIRRLFAEVAKELTKCEPAEEPVAKGKKIHTALT
jgi:hypothetical protein